MEKKDRALESWASPLIGVGVAQLVFSLGIITPSVLTIAACADFYHVSFAIFPGLALFCTGAATISGFKVCLLGNVYILFT